MVSVANLACTQNQRVARALEALVADLASESAVSVTPSLQWVASTLSLQLDSLSDLGDGQFAVVESSQLSSSDIKGPEGVLVSQVPFFNGNLISIASKHGASWNCGSNGETLAAGQWEDSSGSLSGVGSCGSARSSESSSGSTLSSGSSSSTRRDTDLEKLELLKLVTSALGELSGIVLEVCSEALSSSLESTESVSPFLGHSSLISKWHHSNLTSSVG